MDGRGSPIMSFGIGTSLAAFIHAEIDPASDFPGGTRQYAAYSGLEPSTFQLRTNGGNSGAHQQERLLALGTGALPQRFRRLQTHEYFAKTYRQQHFASAFPPIKALSSNCMFFVLFCKWREKSNTKAYHFSCARE